MEPLNLNLDGLAPEELLETAEALSTLAAYAKTKARAMQDRASGAQLPPPSLRKDSVNAITARCPSGRNGERPNFPLPLFRLERIYMQEKLTQAARCALAELIAIHYEGGLTATGKTTVVYLHDALQANSEKSGGL